VAVSPWSCGRCEICDANADHAAKVAHDQHSLRLVPGISFRDSLRFERRGIRTIEDLLSADDVHDLGVAAQRLAALKLSCAAVMGDQPMVRKPLDIAVDPNNLVVLDTEHGGASAARECG
jgi:predicted RecB family nuclease